MPILYATNHEAEREAGGGQPGLHGGPVLTGHLPLDLVAAAATYKAASSRFLRSVIATTKKLTED